MADVAGLLLPDTAGLPTRLTARVECVGECWLWTGTILSTGYGQVWWGNRPWLTHRLTYTLEVGPIPDGLTLDHLCRVRACCRPSHLEPVSRGENVLRGNTTPAANLAKTACPEGHEYDYVDPRGWRKCRECENRKRRERRAMRRSA